MSAVLVFLKEPEASMLALERLGATRNVAVHRATSFAEAERYLPDTEILITLGAHLGADARDVFARAPKLQWVQLIGTGFDNVAEHLTGRNVALTRMHGLHGRQMSEAALSAMLAFSRKLPRLLRNQAIARWDRFPSVLLNGKTVGILGIGSIAETLAPICKAFGMHVVGISGARRAAPNHFDAMRPRSDMASAVADLDFLVVLAPHSPATHHLISATTFNAMKSTAYLINLARGGVVDEIALCNALDAGEIAGAALDVFETEPLPEQSAFWRHEKVIVTPHVAGLHDGYASEVFALIAENLRRFLSDGAEALFNQVNLSERLPDAAA